MSCTGCQCLTEHSSRLHSLPSAVSEPPVRHTFCVYKRRLYLAVSVSGLCSVATWRTATELHSANVASTSPHRPSGTLFLISCAHPPSPALFIGLVYTLCFFIIPLYCMHVRMPYVLIKELTYLLTYFPTDSSTSSGKHTTSKNLGLGEYQTEPTRYSAVRMPTTSPATMSVQ